MISTNFKNNFSFLSNIGLLLGAVSYVQRSLLPPSDKSCLPPEDWAAAAACRLTEPTLCHPTPADSYLSGIVNKTALSTAPNYIHHVIHPGVFYSPNGKTGFVFFKGEGLSETTLSELYNQYDEAVKENPIIMKRQMNAMCPPTTPDPTGCTLQIGSQQFIINLPKKKIHNHQEAMNFLRSWIGKIDTLSTEQLEQNLLKAHGLLFSKMNIGQSTGTYRTADMLVFPPDLQDHSSENLMKLVLKKGGSQEDVAVLKNMMARQDKSNLSEDERRILSLLVFVPCGHREVPLQMKQFFKDLQETVIEMKQCGRIDPLALGSFVHRKIGEIHPFNEGNGRIARAMMNAVLMEYGVDPVVFFDDEAYTKAIQMDGNEPGYFTQYLLTEVFPQMANRPQYTPIHALENQFCKE